MCTEDVHVQKIINTLISLPIILILNLSPLLHRRSLLRRCSDTRQCLVRHAKLSIQLQHEAPQSLCRSNGHLSTAQGGGLLGSEHGRHCRHSRVGRMDFVQGAIQLLIQSNELHYLGRRHRLVQLSEIRGGELASTWTIHLGQRIADLLRREGRRRGGSGNGGHVVCIAVPVSHAGAALGVIR